MQQNSNSDSKIKLLWPNYICQNKPFSFLLTLKIRLQSWNVRSFFSLQTCYLIFQMRARFSFLTANTMINISYLAFRYLAWTSIFISALCERRFWLRACYQVSGKAILFFKFFYLNTLHSEMQTKEIKTWHFYSDIYRGITKELQMGLHQLFGSKVSYKQP